MQRDALLVQEMITAIDRIIEITQGQTADTLDTEHDRRDSLLWNFTVLGEAASQVSDELKSESTHIPWQDPIRVRNRIVHGYWSADIQILLAAANEDLPALRLELIALDQ